jgi:hypothetical protein
MFLKIIPERANAGHDHARSFITDRTIRRIIYDLRGAFDQADCFFSRPSFQNIAQKIFQLAETDTAWHAFAARLGMAKRDKAERRVHRA